MKDNLLAKFSPEILTAVKKELPNITKIDFLVDANIDNPSNSSVIDCQVFYKEVLKKSKKPSSSSYESKSENYQPNEHDTKRGAVSERYTLENFIVGPSNQLAYSASEAVVRNP